METTGGNPKMKLLFIVYSLLSTINVFAQSANEFKLMDLANQDRAKVGIQSFRWNDNLYRAAKAHSDDMATHNCFQHDSCNGEKWITRVSIYYPGWIAIGENIGMSVNDPAVIHKGWMDSPGHRANILNSNFNEFGAAITMGQTNFGMLALATEDFGSRGLIPVSPTPHPSVTPKPSATPVAHNLSFTISQSAGPDFVMVVLSIKSDKNSKIDIQIVGLNWDVSRTVRTNSNGIVNPRFKFPVKAKGTYSVEVSKDGYGVIKQFNI